MKKILLLLLACAFSMPSAWASQNDAASSYVMTDDDDDDDDEYTVGLHRPVIEVRSITANRAELMVKVRVHNKTGRTINGVVEVEIEDEKGREVARINDKVIIPAGKSVVSRNAVTIKNPRLHRDYPSYRYEAEAEVLDRRGEEISKSKETRFFISEDYVTPRKNAKKALSNRNKK